jgi:hypothetical protein
MFMKIVPLPVDIVLANPAGFKRLAATGLYDFRMMRDATCNKKRAPKGARWIFG